MHTKWDTDGNFLRELETQWEGAKTDGTEMDQYILCPASLIPQFVISVSAFGRRHSTKGDEPIAATTAIVSNSIHDASAYSEMQ